MLLLLLVFGCGPAVDAAPAPRPAPADVVAVLGSVTGWDGSGDVAIEACGAGVLVDQHHRFALGTATDCELRVVWERDGARAEGPWHPLPDDDDHDDVVQVVLPMPAPTALRPLSAGELEYRDAAIRQADRELHQDASGGAAATGPSPPGV